MLVFNILSKSASPFLPNPEARIKRMPEYFEFNLHIRNYKYRYNFISLEQIYFRNLLKKFRYPIRNINSHFRFCFQIVNQFILLLIDQCHLIGISPETGPFIPQAIQHD